MQQQREGSLVILAIDDQEELLGVLSSTLETDGHQVITTCSATEGLSLAEKVKPDVILLDLSMPEMNGLEVLQVLRQSPRTERIPVLVLTAQRETHLMADAFRLGAEDYLQKPYNIYELRARVRHHARLKQVTDEAHHLQELNRLKEDFIAILSHELRTPLTAIFGFTELVMNQAAGPLTSDQFHYLEIVMQRAGDLHHLIEQLLEFNLIKTGQRRLRPTSESLQALVQAELERTRVLRQQKELRLQAILPSQTVQVLLDGEALRQVLGALLNNAVKFTEDGGEITVEASLAGDRVVLQVSDNGIGIPEDRLNVIFDSFRQLEDHSTRRYEGLGLGLTLAKQLVELHGGRIWVESQPGHGATFTVSMPQLYCELEPRDGAGERRSGGAEEALASAPETGE